jgi:hypothetical protein
LTPILIDKGYAVVPPQLEPDPAVQPKQWLHSLLYNGLNRRSAAIQDFLYESERIFG